MAKLLYKTSFLIVFLITATFSGAQTLEGGILLGASNYYGDLSGALIDIGQTKPAGGLLIRYNLTEKWTLKGYVGYGRISGADSASADNAYKERRNLSFYTDVYEASAQVEYNLIKYSDRYYDKKPFVPYVFAGLGIYNFNPKAEFNGQTYELQPLGTEGQGTTAYNDKEKYALTQVCVPFGFGIKKRFASRWAFGFEIGTRYTFTNYLDDVGGIYASANVVRSNNGPIAGLLSDRSAEKNITIENGVIVAIPTFSEGDKRSDKKIKMNDMYIFAGVTLTFKLKGRTHCPRFN